MIIYWIFESFFILSGGYLLWNAVSYDGETLHADVHRLCVKHLLCCMSKGLVVTKNWHLKKPACRPTVLQRWRTGRSAGWLAACTAITVTWQACRYLIDLSGKQLVLIYHKVLWLITEQHVKCSLCRNPANFVRVTYYVLIAKKLVLI